MVGSPGKHCTGAHGFGRTLTLVVMMAVVALAVDLAIALVTELAAAAIVVAAVAAVVRIVALIR